jgi:multiple sugar transport system substrate-binding protein
MTAAGTVWPSISTFSTVTGDFVAWWKKQGVDVSACSRGTEGSMIGHPLTTSTSASASMSASRVKVLDPFEQVWFGRQTLKGGRGQGEHLVQCRRHRLASPDEEPSPPCRK